MQDAGSTESIATANLCAMKVFLAATIFLGWALFPARVFSLTPDQRQGPARLARNEAGGLLMVVSEASTTEDLILALARAQYPYQRRVAAQLLSKRKATEALPNLLDALEDSVEVVQSGAAEALAEIADETTFERLIRNMQNPRPTVRQYSAYVLGQMAKRENKTVRNNEAVIVALQNGACDENDLVRVEAAYALYELMAPSTKEVLFQCLNDEDPRVRMHSANALAKLKGDDAARALAGRLEVETDQDVRRTLASSLGTLGSEYAVDTLVMMLPLETESVRVDIAARLGDAGTPGAIRVLSDLVISDRSGRVRTQAAIGLQKAGDPTTVPVLAKALKDRVTAVRVAASETLVKLADSSVLYELLDAMGDTNEKVGDNATRAVIRLRDLDSVPELIIMLDTSNKIQLARAIAALEAITQRPYRSNVVKWKTWYEENFKTGD